MAVPIYDIIATLGPSSDSRSMWEEMASSGVSAFRLNTSHLTLPQLEKWLELLYPFLDYSGLKLVLDLQGSKWRLGIFPPFELVEGQVIELNLAGKAEHLNILPVPHPDFFQSAMNSSEIILDDAKITLQIEFCNSERISARVIRGGIIHPRKGVNVPLSNYRKEKLSEYDKLVFLATRNLPFVRYAISFLKDAAEMEIYRTLMGQSIFLIAKIERLSAIEEVGKIAGYANEIWLCRGDFGAEVGMKMLAEQVNAFTKSIHNIPRPVLMAGQVLEHMTEHPAPTRSEICFLYDALICGYCGIVLSDETAIGRYPAESCKMAAIFKTNK